MVQTLTLQWKTSCPEIGRAVRFREYFWNRIIPKIKKLRIARHKFADWLTETNIYTKIQPTILEEFAAHFGVLD